MYDTVNPYDDDTQPRFYRELAAELGAHSIVDLGCGTGLITCDLARRGYRMTGVEPSPAMLEIARRRPDGAEVHWISGDATHMGTRCVDLAIMTGHVAQFFLTDESWHAALTAFHGALASGGRLAFESRNPAARQWERWTRAARRVVVDPRAGEIEIWYEVRDVTDEIVSYENHYAFAATGDEVVVQNQLRFRTVEELTRSLADAGFAVERIFGDWDRCPADPTSPELIVVAGRTDHP